ncbi:uncharacterized protein M6G45_000264 isoform 1-T1 [Spheniscus humboldti]
MFCYDLQGMRGRERGITSARQHRPPQALNHHLKIPLPSLSSREEVCGSGRNKKDSKGCTYAPCSGQMPASQVRAFEASVIQCSAVGLHQPGMDKQRLVNRRHLLPELKFRSFVGSGY